MKVAVFLGSYRPQDGGAYTMQVDLFGALCALAKESKHEFVLATPDRVEFKTKAAAAGLQWLPYRGPSFTEKINAFLVRSFPSLRQRLRHRSALEKTLRKQQVDFVWFLTPRGLEIDLPYMAIMLDMQHRKQPWFPEVSEYSEWDTRERRLTTHLRRAAVVITGTNAGKQELTDFFQIPPDRIQILAHPTPAYALEAVISSQSDRKPGFLLYPAQFWPHKNHVNLLIALSKLRDSGLTLPLVLVGSDFGNQSHVKAKISELVLDEQVTVLGFVDTPQLLTLYRSALALTYVSFFGPENLPPLEAFALGCPVIAASVDGAEEQFGDAALLVDPADPDEIAAAIRKIHRDTKLRARLVARGKKRAARWTAADFIRGAFEILDNFEPIRRTWGN